MKMMPISSRYIATPVRLICLLLVIVLAGCKEELYSGLTEKEGNEMLSILLEEGIQVEKMTGQKGQLVTLMVEGEELSRAIRLLKSQGYPRDDFASVGELFKKDGLISSPLEERARYIYGLSQEIAATLSQLDGVITARVHVVMPEMENKKVPLKVSSASVFIKHASSVNIDDFVPQIKMLVNNSIEGLSYDNISVALFPTQAAPVQSGQSMESLFSINVAANSVSRFYGFLAFGILILLGAMAGNVFLYLRMKKSRGTQLVTS
ncbi:type III secretion system inner membrane ring lipoprotein SctJ [Hahella ganghwensis]|uniref:type III secretion system inner membrane ring lipoprotein SctJ n=1 Tax=Hahella ganghwensis TaxID=286420 RepID=UPI0003619DC2|nr:type III secretion inner membrane ring lipoprotein SctJ [Hahella ganghwensis]